MAAHNTCYKKKFTQADIDECIEWFTQHKDELPASLRLDEGLNIPDLPFTVQQMIVHLKRKAKDSVVYAGQFSLLMLIRDKISS